MRVDMSFWRFVIIISFAKTFLWQKGDDVYYFHVGTFSRGDDVAVKIIILPFSLMVGFAK